MRVATNPLAIAYVEIGALAPYDKNARTHDEAQIAQIVASISEFGFVNPILASSDGTIVAGHGRLSAAIQLGLDKVPVIILDHLTPAQRRALVIVDNRIAENAGWDLSALQAELEAIQIDGEVNMTGLGFSEQELDEILSELSGAVEGLTDEDAVPEAPVVPVSQRGDLWLLGPHRLLCGNATTATDVRRLLGDDAPRLMVSDPPYGVQYDPGWRNEAGVSSTQRTGIVQNDDRADWREAWELFPGDVAYVWHGGLHADTVKASLEVSGYEIRSQIVWRKPRFVLSRGHFHWQHEPAWYAVRKSCSANWQGARDQSTVWDVGFQNGEEDTATIHGTQKPVECMLRPMLNNSAPGDFVYEPFSGSGTSLIAAQKSNRRCLAMEISPQYVDLSITRWQNYSGLQAVLADSGQTYEEVRRQRLDNQESADTEPASV